MNVIHINRLLGIAPKSCRISFSPLWEVLIPTASERLRLGPTVQRMLAVATLE